jgi:hypothetical protein
MKTPRLVVLLALFSVFLVACNSQSAMLYNNMMVAKENSLAPDIQRIAKHLKNYSDNAQYDSVAVASKEISSLIDKKIGEVDALRMPSAIGADVFKKAYLDYFRYIRGVYDAYTSYGEAKTEEARSAEQAKLKDLVKGVKKEISKLKLSQKKFASDNGFSVTQK